MDTISTWATKIAEAAAPDKIDLAPIMTEAFMRGGKEKEELFKKQDSNVLGGFGVTEAVVIFPSILRAMAFTATQILGILSLDTVTNFITSINNLLDIYNKLKPEKNKPEMESSPEIYLPLKDLINAFSKELRISKLPPDKCELITYHVLITLRWWGQGAMSLS